MVDVTDSFFLFPSRRRHTRSLCDWSSDVCSSDLAVAVLQLVVSTPRRQRNGRFLRKRPRGSEKRGVLYRPRGIPPAALARPPLRRPGSRHHLMSPAPRPRCYESADLRALTPLSGCSARSPPSGHLCAEVHYPGRYEHPRRWVVSEEPFQSQRLLRRFSPLHKEHFRGCNRLPRNRVVALSLVRSGPSLHPVALFSPERLRDSFLQTRYRGCNADLTYQT